jgi:hypothetical protein
MSLVWNDCQTCRGAERWTSEEFALGPRHDPLREAIGVALDQLPGTTF